MSLAEKTSASLNRPHAPGGFRRWLRRINWPMLFGSLLVLMLFLVAFYGPQLAPQDPMQQNYTLKVNGQVIRPPYPPFEVEGFPLGTDSFGRDILSRLMWAVRPTLMMVSIVAVVRLVLGILIGLWAGWATRRFGRLLDALISGALAVPVLIVALIGIAAVGIERGLVAFIIGLALTGWAETARLVAEQTRSIRGQAYVEAAQALGASDGRILSSHILRQIMPLVWMLLAFEVSGSLLIVAELGFLGYYIGGGVWVDIFDFVAVNTTGLPELGQMLATALVTLTDPSALIAVGSVMFLAILGFNLLGEGLRARLEPSRLRARRSLLGEQVGEWLEEKISRPVTGWVEDHALQLGLAALVVLLVGGWSLWWETRPARTPVQSQARLVVPGGQYWATERHDPQGSRWVDFAGPSGPDIRWSALIPGGAVGGPVVAADGTVIAAGLGKILVAYRPSGEQAWQEFLAEIPVGTPALGPNGEIYVAGEEGGLMAFSADGKPAWHFIPDRGREATSGPVVAADGTIYYTRVDHIQAVSPTGEDLWLAYAADGYLEITPVLSAGGSYIFLKNAALAAANGAPLALGDLPLDPLKTGSFTDTAVFIGADRQNYLRLGHEIIGWRATEGGVEMQPGATWNYQASVAYFPADTGVTPEGLIWLFYGVEIGDTRLVWIDKNSRVLSNARITTRQSFMVGVDKNSVSYFCASEFGANPKCYAVEQGAERQKWEISGPSGFEITGAALAPGRLYFNSGFGQLVAVGSGQ